MENLVSIIVPIYNVDKYLSQCIESIINQTYRNIEVILINDGSTDKSYEICLKYAILDKRIQLINKDNGGSANAKNYGLGVAKGDYIVFVDSDDFIELDMIEYMVNTIIYTGADIVQCDFESIYKDTIKHKTDTSKETIISSEKFLELFLKEWKSSLFWNKLFKKEVIANVYFNEGRCIDDEFFTYKCVMNARLIAISDKVVYNYRIRKSSVMRSKDSQKQILKDRIDYLFERYNIVSNVYKDLDRLYLEHMLTYFLIISKEYHIDEYLINYIKDILKIIKYKIIVTNIDIVVKYKIIKLMMVSSKKYMTYKSDINTMENNCDSNYFE